MPHTYLRLSANFFKQVQPRRQNKGTAFFMPSLKARWLVLCHSWPVRHLSKVHRNMATRTACL